MTTTAQAPAAVPGSMPHSDGAGAFIPVQTRSERPASYDPADFAMPTGREVNWRHTPIDRLGAILRDEASDADAVTMTMDAAAYAVAAGTAVRGEIFRPEDRASALAWKHAASGMHVRIPAEVELGDVVRIDVRGAAASLHGADHLVVEAMPHSRATVLLYHSGTAQYLQNVEIIVRDGAALTLVTVQRWDDDAIHLAAHQARVDRDGALTHVVVSLGGGVVRVNPSVDLAGAGSQARLYGLSFADSGQHLESQVYLHHRGPHTSGDVLYKGALQGAQARSVWIGDVLIGPDAVGTDSYEANRNLVLTDGARADSIPNLEIETGDIVGAGHASATGRFDDEQLFYLQARGIPEAEARRLVVRGFLAEIVQRIGIPSLEQELNGAIERELEQGEAA